MADIIQLVPQSDDSSGSEAARFQRIRRCLGLPERPIGDQEVLDAIYALQDMGDRLLDLTID
jgi:hypothetical protein